MRNKMSQILILLFPTSWYKTVRHLLSTTLGGAVDVSMIGNGVVVKPMSALLMMVVANEDVVGE